MLGRLGEALAAAAAEHAFGLQLLQHETDGSPIGALESEMARDGGDIGLALLAHEAGQGLTVWNAGCLARRLGSGHGASFRRPL